MMMNLQRICLILCAALWALPASGQTTGDTTISPHLRRLISAGEDPRVSRKIPAGGGAAAAIPAPSPAAPVEAAAPAEPRRMALGAAGSALVYPNIRMHPNATTTQSEMSVAVHPFDPAIVLAGSNAVTTSIAVGSQGFYSTTDAGATWFGKDTLPTHSPLSAFMSDPAVAIDLDGYYFLTTLLLGSSTDLITARSTNNGATWTQTTLFESGNNEDKDHLTVDCTPGSPFQNRLYAAFTDFTPVPSPVKVACSTDRGASFGPAKPVSGSIGTEFGQGVNLATGPNGELYAAWSGYDAWPASVTRLGFNTSTDGGATWQVAKSVANVADIRGSLIKGPNTIRTASFPSMAVDRSTGPRRGWIYIVYPARSGSAPDIFLVRSSDAGATWSVPRRVNQDGTGDQWQPWVSVDPATGGIYVVYYDSRNFPSNDSTQVFISASLDGGDTFDDLLISDQAFLPAPVPGLAGGYMGDYIGVAALDGIVWPCWNDNRTGIQQAYTSRVVHLQFGARPQISVGPDTLDFGDVFLGYPDTMAVSVRNMGYPDTLLVSGLSADSSCFAPQTGSFALPGGTGRRVNIVFTPPRAGGISSFLTVTSNDSARPSLSIVLRARVVHPPVAGIAPDSLDFTLNEGDSAAALLTLANTGLGTLDWNGVVRYVPAGSATSDPTRDFSRDVVTMPLAGFETYETPPPAGPSAGPAPESLPFFDGFEDGDFSDWTDDGGPGLKEVTGATAGEGLKSFHTTSFGAFQGIHKEFIPGARPDYMSFYVRAGSTTLADGYFVVVDSTGNNLIWFFAHNNGFFYINGDVGGDNSFPYNAHQWYRVELRNVDWTGKRFDYYVDGALIKADISFRSAAMVTSMRGLYLFNMESSEAWWDGITIGGNGNWLSLQPQAGTVAPGLSVALRAGVATGALDGGTFHAAIDMRCNDPLRGLMSVPVRLRVIGAPNLLVSRDTVDFGQVYVTYPDTLILRATNNGSDTLRIGSMAISNPLFSIPEPAVVNIPPRASSDFHVVFRSTSLGSPGGTLVIASNDPGDPAVTVRLKATVINYPIAGVAPDSLGLTLNEGDSATSLLTITNTGLGTLHYLFDHPYEPPAGGALAAAAFMSAASFREVFSAARSAAAEVVAAGARGEEGKPLFAVRDEEAFAQKLGAYYAAAAQFGLPEVGIAGYNAPYTLSNLLADSQMVSRYMFVMVGDNFTLAQLQQQPAGVIVDEYDYGITAAEASALSDFMDAGGPVLFAMDDLDDEPLAIQAQLLGRFGLTGTADHDFVFGRLNPAHPIAGGLDSVGSLASENNYYALGDAVWVVRGSDSAAYVTARDVVSRRVVFGEELTEWWFTSSAQLVRNAIAWTFSADWLTKSPLSGTVPPGGSQDVHVGVQTKALDGGTFHASLSIGCDDPARPAMTVPVGLRVIGKPDIAAGTDTMRFGEVYEGYSRTDSLEISNNGSDTLHIRGLAISNPCFSLLSPAPPAAIASHRRLFVRIRFSPLSAQPEAGVVTIQSDDPQDSLLRVGLTGSGIHFPVAGFSPDSMSFVVNEGDSAGAPMTVTNSGLGTLSYRIRSRYAQQPALPQAASLRELAIPAPAEDSLNGTRAQPGPATVLAPSEPDSSIKILTIDIGMPENALALDMLGFAYTKLSPAAFDTVDFSRYDLIYVGWTSGASTAGMQSLYGRKGDIRAFIEGGGGLVALSNPPGTWLAWQWVPFALTPLDHSTDLVHIVDTTHPVTDSLADALLSSWATSVHNTFGACDTVLRVLARDPASDGVLLAGEPAGGGRVVVTGMDPDFHFVYDSRPGAGILLRNMIRWAGGKMGSWLSENPASGTLAPGASALVQVEANSGTMVGGTYLGSVEVASNDPAHPVLNMPVRFRVIGIPRIAVSPDTVAFGEAYVGFPDTLSIVVRNLGSDTLRMPEMSISLPEYTPLDSLVRMVLPRRSVSLRIRFLPDAAADFTGTLTIRSNDLADSVTTVVLTGRGVNPPVIGASPDSLSFTINEGDSSAAPLALRNTGLGTLEWTSAVSRVLSAPFGGPLPVRLPAVSPISADDPDGTGSRREVRLDDAALLPAVTDLSGRHIAIGGHAYTVIISDLRLRGASVSALYSPITATLLDTLDVLALDDELLGSLTLSEIGAIRTWLQSGGKGLLLQGDNSSSMPNANLLLAGTGVSEISWGMFFDGVFTNIIPHAITAGVDTVEGSAYGAYCTVSFPAQTLVYDTDGRPHAVVSTLGSGLVFAAGNEITDDYTIADFDMRLFSNQVYGWLAGGGGSGSVTLTPASGTIAAEDSAGLRVDAKSGTLYGGTYRWSIDFTSNDPARHHLPVPVQMRVIGVPNIRIDRDTMDFGDVWVDSVSTISFRLRNLGSDTLRISAMTVTSALFTLRDSVAMIGPHGSADLRMQYAPVTAAADTALFQIGSNDPDDPVVTMRLRGTGVFQPVIRVSPASLAFEVRAGDSAAAPLTIGNAGLGPLSFSMGSLLSGSSGYRFGLEVSDAWGGYKPLLTFGVDPAATYGVDDSLGEATLPPFPPFLEARFLDIPGRAPVMDLGMHLDLRKWYGPAQVDTYRVRVQAWNGYPVTIAWNPDSLSAHLTNAVMVDLATGGSLVRVDMLGSPGFTITGPSGTDLLIVTTALSGWLSASPAAGTVPPESSRTVTVTVKSDPTQGGMYHSSLRIRNNDPGLPVVTVGVDMRVIGIPNISAPDTLAFADAIVGYPDTALLPVTNTGAATLSVSGVNVSGDGFALVDAGPFALAQYETRALRVILTPAGLVQYHGTLTIVSNDPVDSLFRVALEGTGVLRPVLAVTPESLSVTLRQRDSADLHLTILNTGAGTLRVGVSPASDTTSFPDTTSAYAGTLVARGNAYRVDNPTRLREFSALMELYGDMDVMFRVYTSPTITGTFHSVWSKVVHVPGGRGYYSSGPVDVVLGGGQYCCLAVSFSSGGKFYGFGMTATLKKGFGTLLAGMYASYHPMPADVDPVLSTSNAWCQTIRSEPLCVSSVSPDTAVIPSGGSLDVKISVKPNREAGRLALKIPVRSNDPENRRSAVPLFLTSVFQGPVTEPDWNLLSVPVAAADYRTSALFPGAASPAYGYNVTYRKCDTLARGAGYWLKYASARPIDIEGDPVTLDTLSLRAGWNMIGSLTDPVSHGGIVPVAPMTLLSHFYSYTWAAGYLNVDTLKPGRGYWVKADRNGKLVLKVSPMALLSAAAQATSAGPSAVQGPAAEGADSMLRSATITLTDALMRSQSVSLSETPEGEDGGLLELPPVAEGIFDLRFASQRRIEHVGAGPAESEFPLLVGGGVSFPVTISWEQGAGNRRVILEARGGTLRQYPLFGKGSVTFGSRDQIAGGMAVRVLPRSGADIPKEFALLQNYPNPFNPETEFRFRLAAPGRVTLKVYDVLGREAASILGNEAFAAAGEYGRRWNAAGIASGVYYYRLTVAAPAAGGGADVSAPPAGERTIFEQTRKLVIMK